MEGRTSADCAHEISRYMHGYTVDAPYDVTFKTIDVNPPNEVKAHWKIMRMLSPVLQEHDGSSDVIELAIPYANLDVCVGFIYGRIPLVNECVRCLLAWDYLKINYTSISAYYTMIMRARSILSPEERDQC